MPRGQTGSARRSSPRGPARLAPDARRAEITQACAEVISEKGFSATSIREIASRAGVSTGTALHHFAGKEEILLACMELVMQRWADGAERLLRAEGRAIERLDALIEWVLGDPEYDYLWRVYIAFWHEAVFDRSTKASILKGNTRWDGLVAEAVEEAIEAGDLAGDPSRIGKVLSTVICGAAVDIQGRLGRWDRLSAIQLCRDVLLAYRAAGSDLPAPYYVGRTGGG